MSVNPAAPALPSNIAAIVAGELAALAADAQTLAAKLAPGDIVAAVVLPSNGLTDLLDIGGLRVAAELPPTLVPGERIRVEVTGFSGDRINLQILPGPEPVAGGVAIAAAPAPAVAAVIVAPDDSPPAAPAATAAPPVDPRVERPSANGFVPYSAGATARPRGPLGALGSIEARLATARATTAPPAPPHPSATGQLGSNSHTVIPSGPAARAAPIVPRPLIAPRAAAVPPATAPPVPASASGAAASAGATAGSPPRGLAAFAEPVALLRALQLPVTPGNVAAARLALEAPQRLPNALALLERALAASNDPRVNTLRTLVGFLARIEPSSPVLATQIAAFVDHAVVGREAKLVQLLGAGATAASPDPAAPQEIEAGSAPSSAGTGDAAPAFATEHVVYRQAALDYDLKSQLIAALDAGTDAIAAPERTALDAALAGALTAVTGLQLGAAATLAAHPEGLAFTLPIALPSGFAAAHVRIDRDAPHTTGSALDGDNFHIAFVLETQHLGTVAIDLMTVGRTVTLGVKTEAHPAQRVFGSALARLTARLETLRYRVARADASVAPRGIEAPRAEPLVPPARERTEGVDVDA